MEALEENAQQLLKKSVAKRGFKDVSVKTEPGSFKGDNYLGIITKATVTNAENPEEKLDLIVKSATPNPNFRKFVPINEVFKREAYFYEKVLPEYNANLADINRGPLDSFPGYLGSDCTDLKEVLIMDDMKAQGYCMKDRRKVLDLDHVRLVMKIYGKLHGSYYALKVRKPEVAKELAESTRDNFFDNMMSQEGSDASFQSYNNKVLKALQSEDSEVVQKFKAYADDATNLVKKSFDSSADDGAFVINHGDSWVNNMLFKSDDNQESSGPSKVCLLDFQIARLGSPANDLSYFLLTCTDKKLRDEHFEEMLQLYRASMQELLGWFSLKADDFLPMSLLREHLKKFSYIGLSMTITVIHLMLSEQEEIPDFQNMELKPEESVDEVMEKFSYVSKNEHVYNERVRGVILDCIKLGIL